MAAVWSIVPRVCALAVAILILSCTPAPQVKLEPGYTISYLVALDSCAWYRQTIHVKKRPDLRYAGVHIQTSDTTEMWVGDGWTVHGLYTCAETDSVGPFGLFGPKRDLPDSMLRR